MYKLTNWKILSSGNWVSKQMMITTLKHSEVSPPSNIPRVIVDSENYKIKIPINSLIVCIVKKKMESRIVPCLVLLQGGNEHSKIRSPWKNLKFRGRSNFKKNQMLAISDHKMLSKQEYSIGNNPNDSRYFRTPNWVPSTTLMPKWSLPRKLIPPKWICSTSLNQELKHWTWWPNCKKKWLWTISLI